MTADLAHFRRQVNESLNRIHAAQSLQSERHEAQLSDSVSCVVDGSSGRTSSSSSSCHDTSAAELFTKDGLQTSTSANSDQRQRRPGTGRRNRRHRQRRHHVVRPEMMENGAGVQQRVTSFLMADILGLASRDCENNNNNIGANSYISGLLFVVK